MPEGNRYTGPNNTGLSSSDVVADFFPALQAARTQFGDLFMQMDTPNSPGGDYAWLGQVPQMREWVGGRLERELALYTYAIRNKKFEMTLPISLDDLRRDKTSGLRTRIADMAVRAKTFPDALLTTLLTNGAGSASGLGYDGQYFFDTDHNESGTNQTNDLTSSDVPSLNVANPDAPTVDEMADIVNDVAAYMESYTDDQGEPINQDIQTISITSGRPAIAAKIRQAIGAEYLSNGGSNPVQTADTSYRYLKNSRLSRTADVLYFFGSGGLAPFILQEEVPLQTQLKAEGSDEEFDNDRHVFGVKWMGNAGFGMWQRAIRATLS